MGMSFVCWVKTWLVTHILFVRARLNPPPSFRQCRVVRNQVPWSRLGMALDESADFPTKSVQINVSWPLSELNVCPTFVAILTALPKIWPDIGCSRLAPVLRCTNYSIPYFLIRWVVYVCTSYPPCFWVLCTEQCWRNCQNLDSERVCGTLFLLALSCYLYLHDLCPCVQYYRFWPYHLCQDVCFVWVIVYGCISRRCYYRMLSSWDGYCRHVQDIKAERNSREYIHDYSCCYRTSLFGDIGVGHHEQETFSWHVTLTPTCVNGSILTWRDTRQRWNSSSSSLSKSAYFAAGADPKSSREVYENIDLTIRKDNSIETCVRTTGPPSTSTTKLQTTSNQVRIRRSPILIIISMIPSICTACYIAVRRLREAAGLIWSWDIQGKKDILIKSGSTNVSSKLATVQRLLYWMRMETQTIYAG